MKSDKKVQEMQILEQSLQNILLQKQAFQIELAETQSASNEIEKAGEEIYKIIGQLMIKTEKTKTIEELKNKEKLLELRIKTLERQEKEISEKTDKLRAEFLKEQKKDD